MTLYLDKVIRPLALIMPKMSGYVKTFKVKDENKDSNVSLYIWCEAIRKIECYLEQDSRLKNIESNARRVHDNRYIKTDIVTYGDKFDTNMT